jgi:anti-sigma factor RsiW
VKADVVELLTAYVLGSLAEAEQAARRAEIEASPALRQEVDRMTEALACAAEPLAPLAPTAEGRARLMEALAGPGRFRPFFAALARHFDLTVETIRALLARIDDPSAWEASAAPWIKLIHFSSSRRPTWW